MIKRLFLIRQSCYSHCGLVLVMSGAINDNPIYTSQNVHDACRAAHAAIDWYMQYRTCSHTALPAIGGHGENFPYTSSIFSVYVVVEMYGRH